MYIDGIPVVSVEQMRRADAYTIQNFVSGIELMHRAAMGIYNSCSWSGKRVAIVCGSGNNGGDGYALACILAEKGTECFIYRVCDRFSDDGRYYYDIAVKRGVPACTVDEDTSFQQYDIVVDCIFGTGFRGVPSGVARLAIERINASGAYVVCADINSGINGDTGEAELAVKSDMTVSVGFYKTGMFTGRAPELIDKLVNVDIGIVI